MHLYDVGFTLNNRSVASRKTCRQMKDVIAFKVLKLQSEEPEISSDKWESVKKMAFEQAIEHLEHNGSISVFGIACYVDRAAKLRDGEQINFWSNYYFEETVNAVREAEAFLTKKVIEQGYFTHDNIREAFGFGCPFESWDDAWFEPVESG